MGSSAWEGMRCRAHSRGVAQQGFLCSGGGPCDAMPCRASWPRRARGAVGATDSPSSGGGSGGQRGPRAPLAGASAGQGREEEGRAGPAGGESANKGRGRLSSVSAAPSSAPSSSSLCCGRGGAVLHPHVSRPRSLFLPARPPSFLLRRERKRKGRGASQPAAAPTGGAGPGLPGRPLRLPGRPPHQESSRGLDVELWSASPTRAPRRRRWWF